MDLRLCRSELRGTVRAPASKSAAHRLMICAALSSSPTYIDFSGNSDDISATERCLSALGCIISPTSSGVLIAPSADTGAAPELDCGESGSTLRFLLPVAAALCGGFSVKVRGRLASRPLGSLMDAMREHGCSFSGEKPPFSVSGRLKPGRFRLPGSVSSQYVTGLMFALPLLDGDSVIEIDGALSSGAYVDMTVSALRRFGIAVEPCSGGWRIPGRQNYVSPGRVEVEGDWSSAAFWLCAGALGGPVTVAGLDMGSAQPDRRIASLLGEMGAHISCAGGCVTASRGELRPLSVDIDRSPDLMPALAVTLAMCGGDSLIYNAARLRLKESDRLASMSSALTALGIKSTETDDSLAITGGTPSPGEVDGSGDHRVVMASALACAQTDLIIRGCEAAAKSYPAFFDDLAALGGRFERI